jgi:hypothetical protein
MVRGTGAAGTGAAPGRSRAAVLSAAAVFAVLFVLLCRLGCGVSIVAPSDHAIQFNSTLFHVDMESTRPAAGPHAAMVCLGGARSVAGAQLSVPSTALFPPPSPPCSPPINSTDPLKPPRVDLLTFEQACQFHTELHAGCEMPANVPRSITHSIAIGDTGCARSMANHPDQMLPGSIYDCESDVSGVAGAFKTKQRGQLAYPMVSDNMGVRLWSESKSIR